MIEPSSYIAFDDAHWPLLIVHFVGSPSVLQYKEYVARRTAYLARGEKHVGVNDTRRLKLPPPEFREMQAEYMSSNRAVLARTVLGTAAIVQSAEIILLKSASVHQLKTVPYSTVNVTDMRSAVEWAAGRLESAGLHEAAARIRRAYSQGEIKP